MTRSQLAWMIFISGSIAALGNPGGVAAQTVMPDMSAERWCADSGTACWTNPAHRSYLNGVRINADLDLGFRFQGGRSRFESDIQTLPKLSLETNLYHAWIALQAGLFAPSTIRLDERSEAAEYLIPELRDRRDVHFNVGWLVGFSFLDGSLSAGWGGFHYDRRDFLESDVPDHMLFDSYYYVALQPIASIRASLKRGAADTAQTRR